MTVQTQESDFTTHTGGAQENMGILNESEFFSFWLMAKS
jgi:hypothetical protein